MAIIYSLSVLCLVLIGALGYGYYRYNLLNQEYSSAKQELTGNISDLTGKNDYLSNQLTLEQQKNSTFEDQINGIASTVGTLSKLSTTDKELLQKYSKVYFLNENYVPSELATISPDYVYEKDRVQKVHEKMLPYLTRMMNDAKEAGKPLLVISAYRSFGSQASLKTSYKMTYGSGANQFSADQGYSEHQLGTALDFTTPDLGADFSSFKSTDAYKWLQDNAYKYGFILSYPEGNSYYTFEPWHWRFVGISLAQRLHFEKENFYDLDQRVIDNYLINIFD